MTIHGGIRRAFHRGLSKRFTQGLSLRRIQSEAPGDSEKGPAAQKIRHDKAKMKLEDMGVDDWSAAELDITMKLIEEGLITDPDAILQAEKAELRAIEVKFEDGEGVAGFSPVELAESLERASRPPPGAMESPRKKTGYRDLKAYAIRLLQPLRRDATTNTQQPFEDLPPAVRELAGLFNVTNWSTYDQVLNPRYPTPSVPTSYALPSTEPLLDEDWQQTKKRLVGNVFDGTGARADMPKQELTLEEIHTAYENQIREMSGDDRDQVHENMVDGLDEKRDILPKDILRSRNVPPGSPYDAPRSFRSVDDIQELVDKQYEEQIRDGFQSTVRRKFKKDPASSRSLPFQERLDTEIRMTNVMYLNNFVNERGMILPRRLTGLRPKSQIQVARCVKRARTMGFMPRCSKLIILDKGALKDKMLASMREQEISRDQLDEMYPEYKHLHKKDLSTEFGYAIDPNELELNEREQRRTDLFRTVRREVDEDTDAYIRQRVGMRTEAHDKRIEEKDKNDLLPPDHHVRRFPPDEPLRERYGRNNDV